LFDDAPPPHAANRATDKAAAITPNWVNLLKIFISGTPFVWLNFAPASALHAGTHLLLLQLLIRGNHEICSR
jgi:hypothetical protein